MDYTLQEGPRQVTLTTPEVELGFSRDSGALTLLRRPGGQNYLGRDPRACSLDVLLPSGWMSQRSFARYLSHQVHQDATAITMIVRVGLGPLLLQDIYSITGTMIRRSLKVKNVGLDELQLMGIWQALPGACIGSPESCRFEAPANGARPRLAVETAARLRRFEAPGSDIATVVRRGRPFESAPDRGPGLLGLHGTVEQDSLLCWYFSQEQPAWPAVEGGPADQGLALGHEIGLAGWLPTDGELEAGTQFLLLVAGSWHDAMRAFQHSWPLAGLLRAGDTPEWVRDAAIYALHPGLYGGFKETADALPRLRELGITLLHLLPIFAYDNRSGQPWDGNWVASGSPYAILDFERLEPTLGSEQELRALVARAHSLGMRVLVDFAPQGCARNARYVRSHPHWFARDERGRLVSSHGWTDTWSFDWANPQYQDYMIECALRMVRTFDIDGFRVDAPHHKEPNWDRDSGRHASASSFGVLRLLERLRRELKALKPDAAMLCELYGPVYVATHDFSLDLLPHLMFYQAGLGKLTPYELGEWLEDDSLSLPEGAQRVCFTESHDTRDINPLADAMRGSRLSRLLLGAMVVCGYTPMLWHAQEHGQEQFIRQLLRLRREYPVLRCGETLYNKVPCDVPQVFTALRRMGQRWLVGVFNMGPYRRIATLSLPVDLMTIDRDEYHLQELLSGQILAQGEQRTWLRYELLQLSMTVDPYELYFLELIPGPAPEPLQITQRTPRSLARPRPRGRPRAIRTTRIHRREKIEG